VEMLQNSHLSLTAQRKLVRGGISTRAPVRNVEALIMGHGTLSAIKVVGQRVRLAAQCAADQQSRTTTVLVSANTANG